MNRLAIFGKIRTVLADEAADKEKAMNIGIYCHFAKELGLSKLELSMIAKRIEEIFGIRLPDDFVNSLDKKSISILASVIIYEVDWGSGLANRNKKLQEDGRKQYT